ncbi:MAG: dihydrofolate reductase family protein [Cyclobacteriaceae bacterium]
MRKLLLYIATSLDGYIAATDGSVDWLETVPNPDQSDYGYAQFYESISTTLMGNATYQQVLGFGDFPYQGKENYVFSRQSHPSTEHVQFVNQDPAVFVSGLKDQQGGDIWLVGGGQLNTLMLDAGLIDEILLFQMPIVLGAGIALFPGARMTAPLELLTSTSYASGVSLLHYALG